MPFRFEAVVFKNTFDIFSEGELELVSFDLPELSALRCVSLASPNADAPFLEDVELPWQTISDDSSAKKFITDVDPRGPWAHLSMPTTFGGPGFRTGFQQLQHINVSFRVLGAPMKVPLAELQELADLPRQAESETLPRFIRSITFDYRFTGAPDLEVEVDMQVNLKPRGRIRAGVKFTAAIKGRDLRRGSSKLAEVRVTSFKLTRFLPRLLNFITGQKFRAALWVALQHGLDKALNEAIEKRTTQHEDRPIEQLPLSLFSVASDGVSLRIVMTMIARARDVKAVQMS